MSRQIVEPEECLRSLADDAVRRAQAGELVLHCSLGVRATANAFVVLGLVPESLADKILAEYQEGLQQHGLGTAWGLSDGELPARSGGREVWEAHAAGAAPLVEVPVAMAVAGVSFPATISGLAAGLRLEWVKLTGGEWRISFRASADDPGGEPDRPSVVMREALAAFTVTDDGGHRYRPRVEGVTWERVPPGRQEWQGDLVADIPGPAPRVLSWLEIASAESGTAERVLLGRPPAEDGTVSTASTAGAASTAEAAAPRWPTPAEGFLAALAKVGDVKVGWTDIEAGKTAEIVAVVADCLLAAGALPSGSALLRAPRPARGPAAHAPIVRTPAWQDALAARWARRAHRLGARGPGDGDDPDDAARGHQHAVLLTPLPLAHASAVVETISVSGPGAAPGTLIGVTLHGRPWVPGAAWPMIAPCFELHADDDQGNGYEGTLAGFGQASGLEGKGTFWLWPPVADDARSLTITVSTLWEGARVQVPLPPSAPQPATPPAPA